MEKQGHQKVPPLGSLPRVPMCFQLPVCSRCLDTCQQRKQAAISEENGVDPVSTWHLRNLVGGRQLLVPPVLSQEQPTSTTCTYIAKGGGVRLASAGSQTYHGHMDLVALRVGFKKALCSVSWHSQKEICTPSPSACQDTGQGCLKGPCDHSTAESVVTDSKTWLICTAGWTTGRYRVWPAHWLKCQIPRGIYVPPYSEVLPSVCPAGLSLGLDLKLQVQLGRHLVPFTPSKLHTTALAGLRM